MFETQQFRTQLTDAISTEAGREGLARYQTAAVEFLFELARNNEDVLMPIEFKKSLSERRGVTDALRSARELVQDAAGIARRQGETTLTRDHLERAYKGRYCRVWPFCK